MLLSKTLKLTLFVLLTASPVLADPGQAVIVPPPAAAKPAAESPATKVQDGDVTIDVSKPGAPKIEVKIASSAKPADAPASQGPAKAPEAPKALLPVPPAAKAEAPKAEVAKADAPKADAPKAEAAKLDVPKAAPAAEEAPAQVVAPDLSQAKPVAKELPNDRYRSVAPNDIKKYIHNFKVRRVSDESGVAHLEFLGFVDPGCFDHLRLELDTPSSEDDLFDYGVRLETTNFVTRDGKKFTEKADDACSEAKTRECTRDNCLRVKFVKGVAGAEGTELTVDGAVKLRVDDHSIDESDPKHLKFYDLSKAQGGPLVFKTAETLAQERKLADEKKKHELVHSLCEAAVAGNEESYMELKDLVSRSMKMPEAEAKRLLDKARDGMVDSILKEFQTRLKDRSIDALNHLIDDVYEFGNERYTDKVGKAVALLLEIADKARPEGSEHDLAFQARLKLVERALKAAHELEPDNRELADKLSAAKLVRYNWAAATGNDTFWNDQTRREAMAEQRSVSNRASHGDGMAKKLSGAYGNALADALTPSLQGIAPNGTPLTSWYVSTNLDSKFAKKTIQETINELKEEAREANSANTFSANSYSGGNIGSLNNNFGSSYNNIPGASPIGGFSGNGAGALGQLGGSGF